MKDGLVPTKPSVGRGRKIRLEFVATVALGASAGAPFLFMVIVLAMGCLRGLGVLPNMTTGLKHGVSELWDVLAKVTVAMALATLLTPIVYLVWGKFKTAKASFTVALTVGAGVIAGLILLAPIMFFNALDLTEDETGATFAAADFASAEDVILLLPKERVLPAGARDVKCNTESTFGEESCEVCCMVERQDLEAFAQRNGYAFKWEAWTRGLDLERMRRHLKIRNDDDTGETGKAAAGFLCCAVDEKRFGRYLEFVYDIGARRLYVHCWR